MAGPVPSYLTTQTAAQTAFTVPFGLLSFVNSAISAATAAGEFNVTVDCSMFVTEDVSNLRIYLDSLGYNVEFAKDTNNKSLNIDWSRFLDIPGTEIVVDQGTTPWIVAGTVTANQGTSPWVVSGSITTSPDVNIHDSSGNTLGSTGTSLNVDVTNTVPVTGPLTDTQLRATPVPISGTVTANAGTGTFLVDGSAHTQPVSGTVAAAQSGAWTTGRTWSLLNTTDSVNVGNFPATQPVSGTVTANQGTSPWVVSGTVTANAGTGTFLVDGSAHTQPVSGTVTANAGTGTFNNQQSNVTIDYDTGAGTQNLTVWGLALPASGGAVAGGTVTNPVRIDPTGTTTQPVSGTVTANAGTGNFTVVQATGTNLHTVLDSGTLTSITNALPAGTNVIGHVITDSGSTTAVTGNVTVVQPTGTNLHAVMDSGSTTVVTGNVTVIQATGTNLHTVVDSGSITVNNTAGASAVNIQDGGNSITVDGTVTANQGTANTLANRWPVIVTDGTNTMPTADVASRAQFDKITDGTDTLGVNPDGSIVIQPILEYYVGQGQVFTLTGSFNAATGGSDNPILLIKNPNASGKTLRLRKLYVGCNVANVIVSFSIYYAPTITANGTAATPRNNLIGNGTASVTQSFSLPTLSSLGTIIFDSTISQNGTSPEINPAIDVPANQTIVITANPATNNRSVQITTIWMEV